MPLPPPPAAALIRTGKPIERASRSASASLSDSAVGAGHAGDLGRGGDLLGLGLQAHLADRLVGRADELEVAAPADLGEMRVLAQEAVAGMDRLHVGHLGGGDEPGNVQITVDAGGLADADGAVGQGAGKERRGRPGSRPRPPRCPAPCRPG